MIKRCVLCSKALEANDPAAGFTNWPTCPKFRDLCPSPPARRFHAVAVGQRRRPPGHALRRMIRRSAATAAAACTSSSGFVRTLARGRGRGPRGAPGRRREPRHELPQPQQPPQRPAATTTAEASPAADTTSATPINASDKRLAWASLVFGSLAICSLTLNKWEVEKRWEVMWEKPPKRIRPICPLASDPAQGGTQPRPASV